MNKAGSRNLTRSRNDHLKTSFSCPIKEQGIITMQVLVDGYGYFQYEAFNSEHADSTTVPEPDPL